MFYFLNEQKLILYLKLVHVFFRDHQAFILISVVIYTKFMLRMDEQ